MAKKLKATPLAVQKRLAGVDYPKSKQELLNRAKRKKCEKPILGFLSTVIEKNFQSPDGLSKEIGVWNKTTVIFILFSIN